MTQNAARLNAATEPAERDVSWPTLLVVLAAPFMAVLDGFIVILATPSIERQLHTSDAGVQLVVAGYVAAYAACLVAGGRLGDRYGRRRLLVVGMGLFTACSLICGLAPDVRVLVVARCLQGAAAAVMYPQSLALLRATSRTDRELDRAMAAWGVTLGLASVAAQLLGGLLLHFDVGGLGWRAVFLVNIPIGIAVGGVAAVVPESRAARPAELDVAGIALLGGGLFGLVLVLTAGRDLGWPSWCWWLLAASLVCGRLFLAHERRLARDGKAALVPVDFFRGPAAAGIMTTFALYGGQLSFWVLATLYLQRGLGMSPLAAGLATVPAAVGFFAGSTAATRLGRSAPLGALAAATSVAGLATFAVVEAPRPALAAIVTLLFTTGLGFGAIIPTLAAAVLRLVSEDGEAVAAGTLVTAQQAAAACGVALSGVLLSGLLAEGVDYTRSLGLALLLDAMLLLVTAFLARTIGDAAAD